ncbi:hypothetical protein LP43_0134 [Methylophaga thiooxydans]|uniref:Uncharacterized protein n=2 Tax=Methylophaga thiooxydans TaxID=392484 RepID=C0N391_9GAMM|nr:hypothetical protein [Methylophaga thiooxydans]EEF80747.1 hypothetical protein MDMS009_686 [Methylophaga thiooxydans DMS010]KGM07718.1 hypothetical protein LP43_0134 [Methylophaga thiooxydans]
MTNQFDNFVEGVISKGINEVLPRNLKDYWLGYLLTQVNKLDNDESGSDLESLVAAVLLILKAKKGKTRKELSDDELMEFVSQYCTELQLEAVHRNTEFNISAATKDDIFSNRDVEISKKKFS